MSIFKESKKNSPNEPKLVVIKDSGFVLGDLMESTELIKRGIQQEYVPKFTEHRNFFSDDILNRVLLMTDRMNPESLQHIASIPLESVEYIILFSDNSDITTNPILEKSIYQSFKNTYDRALKLAKTYGVSHYSLTGRMDLISQHKGGLCGAVALAEKLREAPIVDLRYGSHLPHDYGNLEEYCLHPTAHLYISRK